jgi:NAD(P)-dependent dehydrogenase (short-subunit alcohol dehydrogenase family)
MARTWFITGASSGFGRALAEAVLARGDNAVLAARRSEPLRALAEMHAGRALPVALDVTDPGARMAALAAAIDRFEHLDVLANIAGRGSLGAAEEFSPDQLRDQMEVNFFGPVELIRAALPQMRRQGSGHILNLTSIGGLISMGGFSVYCASKFALEGWSEALRDEVAPLGIRVTIVEPGAFRTEFAGGSNMRPTERLDAYRGVIDPVETYLYGNDGMQPGDPAKAADAMIAVVESGNPPLRLMLGADALAGWEGKRAAVDADVEAWRAVGSATAYPDAETHPIGSRMA